ncbi:MAG: hypothetical protein QM831_07475 [Kofleriaceae bacterium]
MERLQDRVGVFAVSPSLDKHLAQRAEQLRASMFEDSVVNRWFELRHEMFEELLRVAAMSKIVTSSSAEDAFVSFVTGPGEEWDELSPTNRMQLAREKAAEIHDVELRSAVEEVAALQGAFSLWIQVESAMPPFPVGADVDDVDVKEVERKLDAYVAEQDARREKNKSS